MSGIEVHDLAFEKAQVGVVRRDRTKRGVPHDFGRHVGIVTVKERERLPGDVALDGSMVGGKADLTGIFLRGVSVGWRPFDSPRCYNVHLHAARYRVISARTHQRLDTGSIGLRDSVAWTYAQGGTGG